MRRSDDGVSPGGTSVELTFDPAAGDPVGTLLAARDQSLPCRPGRLVWVQAAGKAVTAAGGAALLLTVAFREGGGRVDQRVLRVVDEVVLGRWYVLSGFAIVPDGASTCFAGVWLRSTAAGSVLRATDAMIAADPPTVPDYFDGDSPGCSWSGAPHASPSAGPLPRPARPARDGLLVGWNDNAVTQAGLTVAHDLALNTEIGMTVLRCGVDVRGGASRRRDPGSRIDWSVEPGPAQIAALAKACREARDQVPAHRVRRAPTGEPPANTNPDQIAPPRPERYGDWARLAAEIAQRLAPDLAAFEVFNEPNLVDFWFPAADAAAYTRLLKASAPVIRCRHARRPRAHRRVQRQRGGHRRQRDAQRLPRGALQRRREGLVDGMAFHRYPGEPDTFLWDQAIGTVRGAMARAGDRSPLSVSRRVGISSTGDGSPGLPVVDETQQAGIVRLLHALLARQPDVAAVCWHTSVSPSRYPPSDPQTGYEFVDRSGRRKPVFQALQAELVGERAALESSRAASSSGRSPAAGRRSARRRRPPRAPSTGVRPSSSGTPPPASPPASTRCGRKRARTTRSSGRGPSPDERDLADAARWKSSACSRWANACGCAERDRCSSRNTPSARSS